MPTSLMIKIVENDASSADLRKDIGKIFRRRQDFRFTSYDKIFERRAKGIIIQTFDDFAFIETDRQKIRLFVHIANVPTDFPSNRYNFSPDLVGLRVTFDVAEDNKGRATAIKLSLENGLQLDTLEGWKKPPSSTIHLNNVYVPPNTTENSDNPLNNNFIRNMSSSSTASESTPSSCDEDSILNTQEELYSSTYSLNNSPVYVPVDDDMEDIDNYPQISEDNNSDDSDYENNQNYPPPHHNNDSPNLMYATVDIDDIQLTQTQPENNIIAEIQPSSNSIPISTPSITTTNGNAPPLETLIANEECKRTTSFHKNRWF